jgi:hypothetical protein
MPACYSTVKALDSCQSQIQAAKREHDLLIRVKQEREVEIGRGKG